MPLYDYHCDKCTIEWEERVPASEAKGFAPECPECGSNFTRLVWRSMPNIDRAKEPYDYLDGRIPASRKVFSGPKVSSKTTT